MRGRQLAATFVFALALLALVVENTGKSFLERVGEEAKKVEKVARAVLDKAKDSASDDAANPIQDVIEIASSMNLDDDSVNTLLQMTMGPPKERLKGQSESLRLLAAAYQSVSWSDLRLIVAGFRVKLAQMTDGELQALRSVDNTDVENKLIYLVRSDFVRMERTVRRFLQKFEFMPYDDADWTNLDDTDRELEKTFLGLSLNSDWKSVERAAKNLFIKKIRKVYLSVLKKSGSLNIGKLSSLVAFFEQADSKELETAFKDHFKDTVVPLVR